MSQRQPRTVFFTENEQAVLDALIEGGDYKKAHDILKGKGVSLSIGRLRGITLQVRNRYDDAKRFVEICERYQEKLSRKDRKKRYITG